MLNVQYLAPLRNDTDFEVWARALFYILNQCDYRTGIAYISASDMVKALGASRNAVDAAVAFLIRKGFVSHINGKGRTKHFRLAIGLLKHGQGKVNGRT
jgi:DNA-binding IclR family transcriptional regulator